ncbi:Putative zinc-finger [Thermomonospora echinospora]|uniref:Putative zinc-finger n=1 Tax=Thermomonospora echinospora TaxID=1992 RepID=A0A1H6D6I1_9ACTN|nr:zf-HC2 domain-containing protein [Thermomonospora echinospora]SEG80325.1 Putative zinc-finger [Thermomonospora echinospora]
MNTRHIDVGAYALDLLEEPDRRAFEAHLATCARCHEELAALRDVAAALDGMPLLESLPETPATDAAIVTDLVQRRAGLARRQRRSRVLLSAAAGVVLLAGGAGTGMALADGGDERPGPAPVVAAPPADGAQALLADGERRTATDPGTGVSGVVAWESKQWGARVALRLSKVRGPLECRLVAVSPGGRARVVTGWSVPDKGYGVPGSPAPLTVQGGVAVQPAQIERFEVRTDDGRTLLTVPVRG